jgi:hypothetical protein
MRAALGVRINDGVSDRHVGAKVTGLKFRKTAPGGFHSASMTINVPRDTFTDLGPADRVYVYGPTGRTLWEGFLDNPASTDGPGGQSLEVSAMGTSVIAQDQSKALVYIDRDLGGWVPYAGSATSANATTSNDPTGGPGEGVLTGFNPGQAIGTNAVAQMRYEAFNRAGWLAGAINTDARSGKVDTGYRTELAYSGPGGTFGFVTILSGTGITTVPANESRFVGASIDALSLRLKRTGGATNIADDDTWSWFTNISVVGARLDRFGTLLTGSGGLVSTTYVRADWVVEDLLGRSLTGLIDSVLSKVEAGTYQIDQLAYHDGATAGQVFDDLTMWEPSMLWEILEHTGRGYRFNYRAWPTAARYEVSVKDGYSAPGSDVDLCNRIVVKWIDEKGNSRATPVYASSAPGVVPPWIPAGAAPTVFAGSLRALEDAGRAKDAEPVTLPEGRGSAANALRIGQQVLASKADPPKAATVVVRRRLSDLTRGGMVMPYEIEPGHLVRVRETGDVLPLTEVEYDDDEGSATLTLGIPTLSIEQRVARLDKAA